MSFLLVGNEITRYTIEYKSDTDTEDAKKDGEEGKEEEKGDEEEDEGKDGEENEGGDTGELTPKQLKNKLKIS